MVADLQEVPRLAVIPHDLEEVLVAILFEIAQEQDSLSAGADGQHQGRVVDLSVRRRAGGLDGITGWPQHDHAPRPQLEGVALAQSEPLDAEAASRAAQLVDAGSAALQAGFGDAADAVARREAGQAAGVVLVRVRQDDEVDASVPDRDALVQATYEEVGVGAAVHEHARPTGGLHEDGVALAHVEDGDAHLPGWPVRHAHHDDDRHDRPAGERDEPAGSAW